MAKDHPLSLPKRRIPACALLSRSAGGDLRSAATLEPLSASLIKQAAFDFLAAFSCSYTHAPPKLNAISLYTDNMAKKDAQGM